MHYSTPESPTNTIDHSHTCPRCGVIDRPTLSPGSGPHACKASCAGCGRFLRWVSLLAPAERHARRVKARMQAMAQRAPSQMQLSYLLALGDAGPPPETMADASARIDALVQHKEVQPCPPLA